MFRRVARAVGLGDRLHDGPGAAARHEEAYFRAMAGLLFLPNSPALMNAATPLGQLAACFVLPVGDSLPAIFGAVRDMALVHQSGGGTGFSFSHLRPKGDPVRETGGVASGPVSFMRVFDVATDVIKQGGLLFVDEVNRHNPTPNLGPLEATNPCGETPLLLNLRRRRRAAGPVPRLWRGYSGECRLSCVRR
jgi:ribonucleotide reductase alpha subunit